MVGHSGRSRTRPRSGCRTSSTLSMSAGRMIRKTSRYGLSASDCSGTNGPDLAGPLGDPPLTSALLPLGLLGPRSFALRSLRGLLGRLARAGPAPAAGAGPGLAPPPPVAELLGGALRAAQAAARQALPPRGHGLGRHGGRGMPPSKAALGRTLRALVRRHALTWSAWSGSGRRPSAGKICARQQRGRTNRRLRKRHGRSASVRTGSGRRASPRRLRLLRLRRRTRLQRGLGLRPRLGRRPLRRRHPRRRRRRHPRPPPRGLPLHPHPRLRHRLRLRHPPLRRHHGLGRRRLRLLRLRLAERRRVGRRRRRDGGLGPLPLASARFQDFWVTPSERSRGPSSDARSATSASMTTLSFHPRVPQLKSSRGSLNPSSLTCSSCLGVDIGRSRGGCFRTSGATGCCTIR